MNTGQLLSTLNLRVVLSVVEGETTVSGNLLLEDADFIAVARSADTMSEIIEWVNENY
jgi:N-dimethylarginine dimethylaminohydrolase